MSTLGFIELKKYIQEEGALRGFAVSSRKAHSMARTIMLRNMDEDDYADTEDGKRLVDFNFHADLTPREAISRWFDWYFASFTKEQAA